MTNFFLTLEEIGALAALDGSRAVPVDPDKIINIGRRAGEWLDAFNRPVVFSPEKEPA